MDEGLLHLQSQPKMYIMVTFLIEAE